LESLFPDSTIIDPAEASHELQKVRILRQNHFSKMSPQMLILLRSITNEHQFFAEKHNFSKNFSQFSDSMTGATSWAILEHSTPNITNKVYANVDPLLLRLQSDRQWTRVSRISQFHFVQLSKQPEPPGEIATEQQIVMAFNHTRIRAVGNLNFHVRRTSSSWRHRMRFDHTPSIDIQLWFVTWIVLNHRYHISRIPKDLYSTTTLVGVREAA
jgi:hypothetical protein